MSVEEAVLRLRRDPQYTDLVRDAYLDEDTHASAERFRNSDEFREVLRLLGERARGTILDVGAGAGIASYSLCSEGALRVYAVEPDPSDILGRGAIARITRGLAVEIVDARGQDLPLPDAEVDVVYARQVLHHIRDLPRALSECARVLKRGGIFLACREHVVDDEAQLRAFLESHPVHRLTGGEGAYPLDVYVQAISAAGLSVERVFGPWDSIINAFPHVRTAKELSRYPRTWLAQHLGPLGGWAGFLPPVRAMVWKRLNRPQPGRLCTFLAVKP